MKKVTLRTLIAYLKNQKAQGRDVAARLERAEIDRLYYGEDQEVLADVPEGIMIATRILEVEVNVGNTTLSWTVFNSSSFVIWSRYFADDIRIEFPSHKAARAFIVEMGRVYGVRPIDRVFTHY